jgi:hypothetical protein
VAGGIALAGKGNILYNCNGPACNAEGKETADRSRAFGTASTALFSVGIVGLASGFVLIATAPRTAHFDKAPPAPTGFTPTVSGSPRQGALIGLKRAW